MRHLRFVFCLILAGCSGEANHLGNPLLLPISGISTALDNAAYSQRRGAVEILVKSNHPALIEEISYGGGPILTDALQTARIPVKDRPTRVTQLRKDLELYSKSPEALVFALMVYGE